MVFGGVYYLVCLRFFDPLFICGFCLFVIVCVVFPIWVVVCEFVDCLNLDDLRFALI